MDNGVSFHNYEGTIENALNLGCYCNISSLDYVLKDCKKIGEYPKDKFMFDLQYANNNFSWKS